VKIWDAQNVVRVLLKQQQVAANAVQVSHFAKIVLAYGNHIAAQAVKLDLQTGQESNLIRNLGLIQN